LGVSYFPGSRRIAEVFLSSHKPGSDSEAVARDGAILVSLALQHGVELSTLQHAVTRSSDGSAATAVGQALDILSVIDLEPPGQ